MIKRFFHSYNDFNILIDVMATKIPETIKGFNNLHKASIKKGVLPSKNKKELIVLRDYYYNML